MREDGNPAVAGEPVRFAGGGGGGSADRSGDGLLDVRLGAGRIQQKFFPVEEPSYEKIEKTEERKSRVRPDSDGSFGAAALPPKEDKGGAKPKAEQGFAPPRP